MLHKKRTKSYFSYKIAQKVHLYTQQNSVQKECGFCASRKWLKIKGMKGRKWAHSYSCTK